MGRGAWAKMRESFRDAAVATALEVGLFDPEGPGRSPTLTGPGSSAGDGKVVKPLSKYAPGETRVDQRTGKVKPRRADPDAAWYIVGGDEEPGKQGPRPQAARSPSSRPSEAKRSGG